MSKQVNITVYRYEELLDRAKRRARNYILDSLYDDEHQWLTESFEDFKKHIFDDEEYTYEQLPDNICYQWDFNKHIGEYEGTKPGSWLINEFINFCNRTYENLMFEEEDIIAYSNEFDMWFFEDGSIFSKY